MEKIFNHKIIRETVKHKKFTISRNSDSKK
jgi:hypothetical protein